MPAPNDVPVFDTEMITEQRRTEINAALQLDYGGTVYIVSGRTPTQGDYDDISTFLRVGDITVKQWFSPLVVDNNGETGYRPCLPPDIVNRRPCRITHLPGHAPRIEFDEEGEPIEYTPPKDNEQRKNMRYRLWLCALLGRCENGLPVGYEREPIFTGKQRITSFYMVRVSACLRKMREIYEGENTYFMYQAWRRFEIHFNEDTDIAPVGWYLMVYYNEIGAGQNSNDVQNYPEEAEDEVL